jgi:hypothetical protein
MPVNNEISENIKALFKENKSLGLIMAISIPVGLGVGAWLYFRRQNRIVRYAKKFIGEQEIKDNMGFVREEFEKMMKLYGDYDTGNQWCMSFVKAIWLQKFGVKYRSLLDKIMTPSTQQTYDNFVKDTSGKFEVSDKPSKGAIVIWRQYYDGEPSYKGHAGIVQKFNDETFETIEGNTAAIAGIDQVAERTHDYKWNVLNGLRLRGFINVK